MGVSKEIYLRNTLIDEIENLSKLYGYWAEDNLPQNSWEILYHGLGEIELIKERNLGYILYITKSNKSKLPIDFCRKLKQALSSGDIKQFFPVLIDYARMFCFVNLSTEDWFVGPYTQELKIKVIYE
jgi:hypothetical protein